jgi:hypothetical protein
MLKVKADFFQYLPPNSLLCCLSSGHTPAGKCPSFATIGVADQENSFAMLNHALDAERVRPYEKPVELENRID